MQTIANRHSNDVDIHTSIIVFRSMLQADTYLTTYTCMLYLFATLMHFFFAKNWGGDLQAEYHALRRAYDSAEMDRVASGVFMAQRLRLLQDFKRRAGDTMRSVYFILGVLFSFRFLHRLCVPSCVNTMMMNSNSRTFSERSNTKLSMPKFTV